MKAIVKLSKQIKLEIDDKDEMSTLEKAISLTNPPVKCTECGCTNLSLQSNKDTAGNTYINIVCKKCYSKAKLGQYKTGGYFWHNEFKNWKKEKQNNGNNQHKQSQREEVNAPTNDDVPF